MNELEAAESAKSHFHTAISYMKKNQYTQALMELRLCLSAPFVPAFVYFQMGCCYLQQKEMLEAQKNFEKTLEIDPRHLQALINLGACYMSADRFIEAIQSFATACRLDEENVLACFNLACALMKARRYIQARDQFKHYLQDHPDDLEAQYHLGFVHLMLEELEEAENFFQNILAVNGAHILALHSMASIALKKNELSSALGFYQRILAQNGQDDIANYMQSALTQNHMPEKAPNIYIENLFDAYAERFDDHLQRTLRYQTPQQLYDFWKKNTRQPQNLKILDLGCGTGLMAEFFKKHANELTGVDLSSEMLKIAKAKNLYTNFFHEEMLTFLQQEEKKFDLIILADVLVYVGNLSVLFQALSKITDTLLFSIELAQDKNVTYHLTPEARYQHSVSYIFMLAKENGFTIIKHTTAILRLQNTREVKGELFYLTKGASKNLPLLRSHGYCSFYIDGD